MTSPIKNPLEEGARVIAAADSAAVPLRLTGGVAIASISPSALRPPLAREYGDIDFVGSSRSAVDYEVLFAELGYLAEEEFNSLHGKCRLFFIDREHRREADVFLDNVDACHQLQLADRLKTDSVALSAADLLLSKLQVVETTPKDYQDALALLLDHQLVESDGTAGISVKRIVDVCCSDWGWWRTVTMVAAATGEIAARMAATGEIDCVAGERLREIAERIETAPKSRKWKIRARIGDRLRWHEEPEGLEHSYT